RTIQSFEAEAISLESGENATEVTQCLWPSRTIWSPEADATNFESGENATDDTDLLWPFSS
ncbi:hypothetical protein FOXB_03410, partial [Fusarium oxysporum f. sp. conglutinans Fo5176]